MTISVKIGLTPAGTYDVATTYAIRDLVQNGRNSWVSKSSNNIGNALPTLPTTFNTYWQLMAEGEKGDQGNPFLYSDFTAQQIIDLKGLQGDAFEYSDFTSAQIAAFKGEKGDAFVHSDFTTAQLAALKGEQGDAFVYSDFTTAQIAALKGEKGDAFVHSDFTTAQLTALKGEKGDAFIYADFTAVQLAALKGEKGDTGAAITTFTGLPTAVQFVNSDGDNVGATLNLKGESGNVGYTAGENISITAANVISSAASTSSIGIIDIPGIDNTIFSSRAAIANTANTAFSLGTYDATATTATMQVTINPITWTGTQEDIVFTMKIGSVSKTFQKTHDFLEQLTLEFTGLTVADGQTVSISKSTAGGFSADIVIVIGHEKRIVIKPSVQSDIVTKFDPTRTYVLQDVVLYREPNGSTTIAGVEEYVMYELTNIAGATGSTNLSSDSSWERQNASAAQGSQGALALQNINRSVARRYPFIGGDINPQIVTTFTGYAEDFIKLTYTPDSDFIYTGFNRIQIFKAVADRGVGVIPAANEEGVLYLGKNLYIIPRLDIAYTVPEFLERIVALLPKDGAVVGSTSSSGTSTTMTLNGEFSSSGSSITFTSDSSSASSGVVLITDETDYTQQLFAYRPDHVESGQEFLQGDETTFESDVYIANTNVTTTGVAAELPNASSDWELIKGLVTGTQLQTAITNATLSDDDIIASANTNTNIALLTDATDPVFTDKSEWSGTSTNLVVSTAITSLGLGTAATENVGTSSGDLVELGENGKIPAARLEAINLSDTGTFNTKALRNSSTAQVWNKGDVAIITVTAADKGSYIYTGTDQTTAGTTTDSSWTLLQSPTDVVTSVDGATGTITTLQIGTVAGTALVGSTITISGEQRDAITVNSTHSGSTHAPTNAEQNVQSDWNATEGDSFIDNKPTIPTSFAPVAAEQNVQSNWTATSGDALILNKPTIPTSFAPVAAEQNVQSNWTATSGDALILNKPTIPTTFAPVAAEQNVQSNWTATEGDALILNKPTIPSAANDSTITFRINGTDVANTITTNQSSASTVDFGTISGGSGGGGVSAFGTTGFKASSSVIDLVFDSATWASSSTSGVRLSGLTAGTTDDATHDQLDFTHSGNFTDKGVSNANASNWSIFSTIFTGSLDNWLADIVSIVNNPLISTSSGGNSIVTINIGTVTSDLFNFTASIVDSNTLRLTSDVDGLWSGITLASHASIGGTLNAGFVSATLTVDGADTFATAAGQTFTQGRTLVTYDNKLYFRTGATITSTTTTPRPDTIGAGWSRLDMTSI